MNRRRSKRGGCDCEKCRECCEREPGWFVPEEIPQAASYLGLSEKDFIQQYCTEHFEDDVYALSPRTKPGSSACVFFDERGMCEIQDVKPYECRKVYGCEGESRHRRLREIIKRMWR
jgi:Fe-S-cluster containining protein